LRLTTTTWYVAFFNTESRRRSASSIISSSVCIINNLLALITAQFRSLSRFNGEWKNDLSSLVAFSHSLQSLSYSGFQVSVGQIRAASALLAPPDPHPEGSGEIVKQVVVCAHKAGCSGYSSGGDWQYSKLLWQKIDLISSKKINIIS
jgi:hypothetical protein